MRLPSSASSSSSTASSPVQLPKAPQPPPVQKPAPGRRRMDKDTAQYKSGYPLQRGSACLSCRKRKMKCDAEKPACGQCVKANRSHDCDYDDGKSKSRTQLLQEKVTMLEARLRELEGSPTVSQSATLPLQRFPSAPAATEQHAQDFYSGGSAVSTVAYGSATSFDVAPFSTHGSPATASPADSTWVGDQYDLRLNGGHAPPRLSPPEDLPWDLDPLAITPTDLLKVPGRWWEAEVLPPRIQRYLVDLFLPHRHQCGFEIDANRFLSSLTGANPPHPALLFAIYALACHFSLSPMFATHEARFVARSLHAICAGLEASDRLVHVLQASCLLAVLFFAKGRLLEGYYHVGAAMRIAVGLGLHQIATPEWLSAPADAPAAGSAPHASGGRGRGSSILAPPVDEIELAERILAFWQVYNLDRCWAVATGLPVALPDDKYPRARIETQWPRLPEEYELGPAMDTEYPSDNYLYTQLTNLPLSNGDSPHTLRVKATTLFQRAARLASIFGTPLESTEPFWPEFYHLDAAILRLGLMIPKETATSHATPGARRTELVLFVAQALLDAAMLQLHAPLVFNHATSQERSAQVIKDATAMIQTLNDGDYAFLDPIMGTCWTSLAEAVVRELVMARSGAGKEQQVGALSRQLDVVVFAMNRLGATVPLAAYLASKVEQSRVVSYP